MCEYTRLGKGLALVVELGALLHQEDREVRVVQHRLARLGFRGVLEVPWGHHVRGDLLGRREVQEDQQGLEAQWARKVP